MRWRTSALLLALLVFAVFLPGFNWFRTQRQAAREMNTRSRLHQLRLAFYNYHDAHGAFPPACVYDSEGTPMHSWRALVLPYIDEEELYERYNFEQPWNGPDNVALVKTAPKPGILRSPNDEDAPPGYTSFLAIVPSKHAAAVQQPILPDEWRNTPRIVVVEVNDSGVPWMEPRDIRTGGADDDLIAILGENRPAAFLTSDARVGTLSQGTITLRTRNKEDFIKRWLPTTKGSGKDVRKSAAAPKATAVP